MSYPQVEMPDGRMWPFRAKTTADLKKHVADVFGIDPDGVALLDSSGRPIPDNQPPPPNVQAVPKPEWGSVASSGERALMQDLLRAQDALGYRSQFKIYLIGPDIFSPVRVYFSVSGVWWPTLVYLDTYPLTTLPVVCFDRVIPPCPLHPRSWHPNIYDTGQICWGNASLLPSMSIIGLLNMTSWLLKSPNHESIVRGHCA